MVTSTAVVWLRRQSVSSALNARAHGNHDPLALTGRKAEKGKREWLFPGREDPLPFNSSQRFGARSALIQLAVGFEDSR